MRKVLPLLFAAFSFNLLNAQTTIPGGVVSGTLTKANSPYLVQGNLLVANGTTLTIEAGVRMNFNGSYKLLVSGRLLAAGNAADSIFFTPVNTATGWQGIRFDNTVSTNDSSAISFCSIQYVNVTSVNGGGIFINNFSKITVSNSSISNCSTRDGCGAAIYISGSNARIIGNKFSFNHSIAGALCIFGGSPLIDQNVITNNDNNFPPIFGDPGADPDIWGGGISCNISDATISNNTISNNSSRLYGGGIACVQGNVNISNNSITSNTAEMGAGIYYTSNGAISGNTIANNVSSNSGAGIYYTPESGTASINKNIIRNNTAAYSGGGLTSYGQSTISNNLFSNNSVTNAGAAYQGGGAVWFVNSNAGTAVSGNIFCNNSASLNGGGIACYNASPSLSNNTLVNNNATNGGGLYCYNSSPSLINMILAGNTASSSGSQLYLYDDISDPSINYSNVAGGSEGIGTNGNFYTGIYQNNIDANPLFVSPTAGSGTGFNGTVANWSLQNASSLIDKGMPSNSYPANDFAGKIRVVNGIIDMGAIENQTFIPPTATVTGGGRVCAGSALPPVVFNFTYGTFPITLQYRINGVAQPLITGINSLQYTIPHAVVGVYTIALVKDTFSTGTSSGSATVTVVNPVAKFSVNKTSQCEKDNNFIFINQSAIAGDSLSSKWNFGDSTFSTLLNPNHSYAKPGIYNVQLVITGSSGCADTAVIKDTVLSFSINTLVDSFKTFQDSLVLDAGAGFSSYSWSNGVNTQKNTVKNPGWYIVTVTNGNGCAASDSIYVKFGKNKTLFIDNKPNLCSNASFDLPVRGKNLTNIVGLQGAISWDGSALRLDTIIYTNTAISFKETDINFTKRSNGYITYLWNDKTVTGKSIPDSASIFILRFSKRNANTSAFSSQVAFNQGYAVFEIDTINLATSMPVATNEIAYLGSMLSFRQAPSITDIYLSACDSVIYNGKAYFDSTIVFDTLKLAGSLCDSLYKRVHISIYQGGVNPTVSINASQTTITFGQPVTFSVSYNSAAGLSPSFQWYKNGLPIMGETGPGFTSSQLNAGDSIFVSLKSSYTCTPIDSVISNKIVMNVFYTVAGKFTTPGLSSIKNVSVNVTGSSSSTTNTNNSNSFLISLLGGKGTNYNLKPGKSNEANRTNGVTTLDIAIIQGHILNINKFTSPYQWIAADVNGSSTVSTLDILLIKRFILGLDNTFTGNRLWAFVDSLNGGLNVNHPLPYKDSVLFNDLSSNKTNISFSGVKLGDVNFDWNSSLQKPAKESSAPVTFYNDELTIKTGEQIRVPVRVRDFRNVLGMQFTLNFDKKKMRLQKIENNRINVQYALNRIDEGLIPFIWNDEHNKTAALNDGDILFEMVFDQLEPISEEKLSISSDVAAIELWDGDFVKHNIIMSAGKIAASFEPTLPVTKNSWELSPNITTGKVTLRFKMTNEKKLDLLVLNAAGQTIISRNINVVKGVSTVDLNISEKRQLEAGLYFIKIIGIAENTVKKVILLK